MSRTANFFDSDVEGEGDASVMKTIAENARSHAEKVVPTLCAAGGSVYAMKPT